MKNTSLGSDAVKLTTSKIIVLVISLVSGMLLSRFRTLEEYGTYSQLIMVINLVTTIFMMGLPNSLNFFLARSDTKEERSSFLSVYYSLSSILSFIVGAILVAITPLLVEIFHNPLIKNFIYFLAVYPWTKIICSSVENVLIVHKKSNLILVYRVMNSVSLLGIILLVQFCQWTFSIYILLYLAVSVLFAILVIIIVKNITVGLRFAFDKSLIKKILIFSIPIGLATMVGTLNHELDKFVIGNLLGTEQLAIYTNASREMPITIVASSITAVLLPQIARLLKNDRNEEAISLWGNATQIAFKVMCFCSAALFVFAPEVMTVLYSEKYLAGVSVFRVYSLVLLLRCTYFGMILSSAGKTRLIFYSSLASLGLNLVLNYLFFGLFGFIGPAIATFIAILTIQIAQLLSTCKVLRVNFSKVFPWKPLFYILLKNAVFSISVGLLKYYLPLEEQVGNVIESIILGLLWLAVMGLIEYKGIRRNWAELIIKE